MSSGATAAANKSKPQKQNADKEKQQNPQSAPASGGPSQAQLRAERRAIQEQQRAAKLLKQQAAAAAPSNKQPSGGDANKKPVKQNQGPKVQEPSANSATVQPPKTSVAAPVLPPIDGNVQQPVGIKKKAPKVVDAASSPHLPSFFRHLEAPTDAEQLTSDLYSESFAQSQIEATFIQLSLMVAHEQLQGPAARCLGLARALRQLLCSVPVQDLPRLIKPMLDLNMRLLRSAKPPTVMETFLEQSLASWVQEEGVSADDSDNWLLDRMTKFVDDQIDKARFTMREYLVSKINKGDAVMLYKPSSLIFECLEQLLAKNISIILLDSPPHWEGQAFLKRLRAHPDLLKCPVRYAMLSAAPSLLSDTSKLLLEGQALTANGNVLAPVGTAYLANVAWSHRIPCLVLCYACQTWDQVLIDSVSYNELGRVGSNSQLCNIQYDLTPGDLVTALITERGILPCTGTLPH